MIDSQFVSVFVVLYEAVVMLLVDKKRSYYLYLATLFTIIIFFILR